MAIPFVVGDRISGVDPFQITTFVWLFSGFLLIGAKSIYVADWPWHDFLRGQVVCRSVGDIVDVTGMPAQMVLLYLLHNEYTNPLTFKGPYTGMFKRALKNGGGLVVDEPVQLSTMLASGFVIFKVLSEQGEHLICIDVRKGANSRQIVSGEIKEYLVCMDVGQEEFDDGVVGLDQDPTDGVVDAGKQVNKKEAAKSDTNTRANKVLMLDRVEFRWTKMLGLYIKDSRFG